MEIDLEILDMLKVNANAKVEYWSAKVGFEYDGSGTGAPAWSEISGNSNAYTKGTWFQTLGNKLQAVSNAIHQKTLRGGANFLVVSLKDNHRVSMDEYLWWLKWFYVGVQLGGLNNRYSLWKYVENDILMGFKSFLGRKALRPYVQVIMTPARSSTTPRKCDEDTERRWLDLNSTEKS